MKYVLMYELAADGMPKARTFYPAHKLRVDEFHARGVLLMTGTWADPAEGAMGIFTNREDAEAFARDDPFILNGVVGHWEIREWNETLA